MKSFSLNAPRDLGRSERNLIGGALLGTLLLAVFWILRLAADACWGTDRGSPVREAAEMATRAFTIPHVIVAFLFMSTAARNRSPQRRGLIAALLALGAGLCLGFAGLLSYGGRALGSLALYSYFLVHELRDEAAFYALLDSNNQPLATDKRLKGLVNGLIALSVVAVAMALLFSNVFRKHPTVSISGASPAQVAAGAAALALGWAAALGALVFWFARGSESSRVLRDHRRLFRLFAFVLFVTAVGAALTGKMYTVVLLHVCVWYVFTCRMLRAAPPRIPQPGWWSWVRGTLPGFQTLHLGLAALMGVAVIVALSGFSSHHPVWLMFAPAALPYWTIMHITVSFTPR